MSSLAITSRTYGPGNQTWIHDPLKIDKVGQTLDLAAFVAVADTVAHDAVLSGVAVGERTSDGLFVPYGGATTTGTNAVWKITAATSGNTTVGYQGATAAATDLHLADAAAATALTALLEGLPDIDPGDFVVTAGSGGDAGKLIVTAQTAGSWGHRPTGAFTATGTGAAANNSTVGAVPTAGATNGSQVFAGLIFDDVPFNSGVTTGNFGFSLVVGGLVRESKLPLAASAAGTAGKVDTAAKTTFTGRTRLVFI